MNASQPGRLRLPTPVHRHPEAVAGLLLGWMLLLLGWNHGLSVAILAVPVGTILLASAVSLLLWVGDERPAQYLALGAGATAAPVLALLLSGAELSALWVALLGVAVWFLAGRIALSGFPEVEGAPAVAKDWTAAARIATDQALLAWFHVLLRPPQDAERERVLAELPVWEGLICAKGGMDPQRWHPQPPDLLRVDARERQLFGRAYKQIHWEAGSPDAEGLPAAAAWQAQMKQRKAHAWVLEHPGKPRPWLLTIHGYRMGSPLTDLRAFDPKLLHEQWGLNLASIVLPLHGPRRQGVFSGNGYLDGDFSTFIHAQRQAIWDMRRLLSWLRLNRHAPSVGVYGLSLGGYNAALLAGLESDLSCVVAGIPVFDMAETLWRHMPPTEQSVLEHEGVDLERLRTVFAPVSPGSFASQTPAKALGIFAGAVDALVWPDQPLRLSQHWGCRPPWWFEGAHLSFAGTAAQHQCLRQTLRAGGLIDANG
ncbi:MAG: alpha/beta hydrolase family protein [Oceanococcaceae bacterium]